jgi:poly(A) polymerase
VRDALLGHSVADVDLATRLAPDEVMRRLVDAGVQAVPTGIAHGTVTAVTPDVVAEVTTLRRDVSTDGRRATVAYTDDWREDAERRDFTINALYAVLPSGEVIDFFGGLEDLKQGRVRFIGDPIERIAEDHLRVLRFFRFHGRFGTGDPDAEGLAACAARANDLKALSRERIREELLKILALPGAAGTLAIMLENGILKPVLPELGAERLESLAAVVAREAAHGLAADPLRRLAALLPPDGELLESIAARLRLSRRQSARLVALARRDVGPDPRRDAYWDGVEAVTDRLLISGPKDLGAQLALLESWSRPRLPISGKDLIARGTEPGPEVSRRLRAFEEMWVAADFPLDAEKVEQLLLDVSSA